MSPRANEKRGFGVPAAAVVCGAGFGFLISWGQFSDPDRIRAMLLLDDLYLYEMMFSAMAVGFLGIRLLRRFRARAVVTGEPVSWKTARPRANHIAGAAIFGLGWAITDSCPAPVAAQLTQGVGWSLFTIAGIFLGIELYFRRQERHVRAPERRSRSAPSGAAAAGADA
jgi:uncharacterized membrane protein YedE/YeeE